jgi:hypothetical protein
MNRQNLLDVAIQTTGMAKNALAIAKANNLSLTEKLTPNTTLIIPEGISIDTEIVGFYQSRDLKPATDVDNLTIEQFKGIDEMQIENTFIVR